MTKLINKGLFLFAIRHFLFIAAYTAFSQNLFLAGNKPHNQIISGHKIASTFLAEFSSKLYRDMDIEFFRDIARDFNIPV